jgi:hypothetical protein
MNQSDISKQSLGAQKSNHHRQPHLKAGDDRWKWLAAAAAATVGGVAQSQAGPVTITLSNNFISATGGNHLNADLTGDGRADITIKNAFNSVFTQFPTAEGTFSTARASINGVRVRAFFHAYDRNGYASLGAKGGYFFLGVASSASNIGTPTFTGSIPIMFKDLHINGGALTAGSLEVTVFGPRSEVDLDSLTYEAHGVPDQGSSLGLFAIGAAGVLALRRWRTAREDLKGNGARWARGQQGRTVR